ncbi:MAG: deoxyhypusine synthase [Nitrosomonadaceae bacterium]|nr:deoxyhypusine synthase [Nitrosomonadaceae bacterium]
MNKENSTEKKELLSKKISHIDIKEHDTRALINAMKDMSFSARDLARASTIYDKMLKDKDCSIILSLAGSTSAAGCMQIYVDMVKNNMVDVIVATGASIVDMDFFEALGFSHYQGSAEEDDAKLRKLYIDRIYDTFIDEDELQVCDLTIKEIADDLEKRAYSSQEFIWEMGKWLSKNPEKAKKKDSLVQVAYENNVPIFCPAFTDSSAGFGLVSHQVENQGNYLTIDSIKDFHDLTRVKMQAKTTGVVIVGGGVPKNFTADTVVCAEVLGEEVPMHKYTVQLTVADERDGALSGSTLKEAHSWGKVGLTYEQMVFSEATLSLPLLASYAYHSEGWKTRKRKNYTNLLKNKVERNL